MFVFTKLFELFLPNQYEFNMNEITVRLIEKVSDEIRFYCKSGLWSLSEDDVFSWLSNFRSNSDHHLLAVILLDSIIFRTNKMLLSSYKQFIASRLLVRINEVVPHNFTVNSLFAALIKGRHSGDGRELMKYFRIAEVNTLEPGESGSTLLRMLNGNLIDAAFHITESVDTLDNNYILLVVDDFMGSGEQSIDFFLEGYRESFRERVHYFEEHQKIIYAPAMGMRQGIGNFKDSAVSEIELYPLEVLEVETNLFFGDDEDEFSKHCDWTVRQAKDIYLDIKRTRNIRLRDWFGRGEAGLPIMFELGAPNQSLGVIYYRDIGWHSLQTRRNA